MPKLFIVSGYIVYFWSNEEGEPIHVHVSKGKPTPNATKNLLCIANSKKTGHQKLLGCEAFWRPVLLLLLYCDYFTVLTEE